MNFGYSRQDLSVGEIRKRIAAVKRDNNFPRKWKDIELDYLYGLLGWTNARTS